MFCIEECETNERYAEMDKARADYIFALGYAMICNELGK